MNENFEKYIEGLSPELQEKARQCKTTEDLNEFIADNDLEIPEDALEMVSGGCGKSVPQRIQYYCNKCNSPVEECTLSEWPAVEARLKSEGKDTSDPRVVRWYEYCPNCGVLTWDEIHSN